MSLERDRPHLRVPTGAFRTAEAYTSFGGGTRVAAPPPPVGRAVHGATLRASLVAARAEAAARRAASPISIAGGNPGTYLEFEASPGLRLAVERFETTRPRSRADRIEVVAVRSTLARAGAGTGQQEVQQVAVFVPEGRMGHFLSRLEQYTRTTPKRPRERRHEAMFDPVATVRLAALRALWTDEPTTYPVRDTDPIWWEVWLRRTDGHELERLYDLAGQAGMRVGTRRLQFEDRIVTLAYCAARQLAASLDVMGDLAELQRAKETAGFFTSESPAEQGDWGRDLLSRRELPAPHAPSVCILDTGVNRGHPLLEGALDEPDCHSLEPDWRRDDHHGHGTEMAGLALYGDLTRALASRAPAPLAHRLESVKILPPRGVNEPALYGAITAEATARVEATAPTRRRVFSMAVGSADGRDRGQPTSWSAAVDALAAGRSFDVASKGLIYLDDGDEQHQRLFLVSAGNVEPEGLQSAHLERSDVEPVHDPAQAWNALTVGACTNKITIRDPSWTGWLPLATRGDLSPWSTTSVAFAPQWPLKPDVVFEGGNVVRNAAGDVDFPCDDLSLLTTFYRPADKLLVPTWATSPATAQVARLAAQIAAVHPGYWPETLRARLVHSAEWTPAMLAHFDGAGGKRGRAQLLRRYGFGVPSLERALRCAANTVTLVVQDSIRPFSKGKLREMHLHELPWPLEALVDLGEEPVRLRVTLSYFVEPSPGRRGWGRRHGYASHGLRLELKGPTESVDQFRKRLNKKALHEEERRPGKPAESGAWFVGAQARHKGSLHSDLLLDVRAADLAEQGMLAVYPVSGWWKEQPKRDRSSVGARYALVVSIETDDVTTDVWTPVAQRIATRVPTALGIPVG